MDLKRPMAYTQPPKYPHSSLEAQMGRTFHIKTSSYFGDGSGRDKGIIMNDGGNSKVDKSYFLGEVFRNTC